MTVDEVKASLCKYRDVEAEFSQITVFLSNTEKDDCKLYLTDRAATQSDRKCLIEWYQQKQIDLANEMKRVEALVSVLDLREAEVMRLHYFEGHTWEQISEEMFYSLRTVHRTHKQALEKIASMQRGENCEHSQ